MCVLVYATANCSINATHVVCGCLFVECLHTVYIGSVCECMCVNMYVCTLCVCAHCMHALCVYHVVLSMM